MLVYGGATTAMRIPRVRKTAHRVAVVLLLATAAGRLQGSAVQAQQEQSRNDGDDQGWAQFSRENTLRGTVVAAAPAGKNDGSFAVKPDSGQPGKSLYGANTRLMRDRDPIRATEVQPGDMLFAAGNVDEKKKTVGAAVLIDIPAEEVRKAREGLGRTWSAGKILAINGTRLRVQRLDGVEQSVAVDENTSFRERRDSITLGDVHPGQGFRAEGKLADGVFTATTLTVFDLKGHEPWLDAGAEAR